MLATDVLQQMINQYDVLSHPLRDGMPPVHEYADDTLIIVRVALAVVGRLERILDDFTTATGLVINFHKSTVVPCMS